MAEVARRLVEAMVEDGQIDRAIQTTRNYDNSLLRANAFLGIAVGLLRNDQPDYAGFVIERAFLESQDELSHNLLESKRREVQREMAQRFAELGLVDKAIEIAQRDYDWEIASTLSSVSGILLHRQHHAGALRAALAIDNSEWQTKIAALMRIENAFRTRGLNEDARDTLAEALWMANRVGDATERRTAWSRVAKASQRDDLHIYEIAEVVAGPVDGRTVVYVVSPPGPWCYEGNEGCGDSNATD